MTSKELKKELHELRTMSNKLLRLFEKYEDGAEELRDRLLELEKEPAIDDDIGQEDYSKVYLIDDIYDNFSQGELPDTDTVRTDFDLLYNRLRKRFTSKKK